jgi:crotonobetainyl-CoA:carnitine CoA-transferase CaiB-like acyl-CoA transferase
MQAPLAGVKVVDLSAVVSGPMAAGMLADQGAEVIKVESRQGDLTRIIGPIRGDFTPLFVNINRGKRCITLDLKQAAACQVVRELAAQADVLIENFRPGAMTRLGLGYEALAALNPRLIYLSITGFGPTGPCADWRAYDAVIQAVSGFAASHPDPASGEPRLLQTLLCDKLTALTAAQAVTAALFARQATGRGQQVELSMLDAAVSFLWPEGFFNHSYVGGAPSNVPDYGTGQRLWRARDGWFAVLAPQDEEFAGLCRVLGRPELIEDERFRTISSRRTHLNAWRAILDPLAAEQAVDELVSRLGAAGVPAGRVNGKAELADDPQVRHNGTLQQVDQPGAGPLRMPRAAAVFSQALPAPAATAARKGEHTREILRELGRDDAAIEALYASGAVG